MIRILILLALLSGLTGDDKRAGRKGNALYREDRYEEAATAYREGLAGLESGSRGAIPAGLLNNLGAALYRQGDFEGARNAFEGSAGLADSQSGSGRGAYNAGNAAFRVQALEESLALYRRAMLRDPSDEQARFNYEFVRRQLDQQQEQQQQDQEQQDQEQQDQDQEQDQQQQDQQQQDQEQQDQEQQEQQEQEQQQEQQPDDLSRQEAERMLEALENDEQQLLRQVQKMKARPRRVEKDW
jgi:tetratricopeptide (TPR) repeat protein